MKNKTLSPGTVLQERYVVLRPLGHGGMGAVYQAVDRRLKVNCAIKETFYTDRAGVAQFKREAHLLAALKQPHIPRVTDYFDEDERYYLVMEYIPGQDLKVWLKQNGLPSERQIVRWARQLLGALDYVHNCQPPIIHRDIKPANIKITPDNHAVLVDFGIAKFMHPQGFTTTGAKAISPGYSPPEQYSHGVHTNARSDIYSLGATLYFMLTGHAPPEATQRLQHHTLPPPSRFHPVSQQLENVVMRALNLESQRRWPDARAMLINLRGDTTLPPFKPTPSPSGRGHLSRPPSTTTPSTARQTSIAVGFLLSITIVVVLAITVGAGIKLFSNGRESAIPIPIVTVEPMGDIAIPDPDVPITDPTPGFRPTSTPAGFPIEAPPPTVASDSDTSGCKPGLPTLVEPVDGASKYAWQEVTFKWAGGERCDGLWQVTLNGLNVCPAVQSNTVTCVIEKGPGEYGWRVELRRDDGGLVPGMIMPWTLYLKDVPSGGNGDSTCQPDEATKPDCGSNRVPKWNTESCQWICQ